MNLRFDFKNRFNRLLKFFIKYHIPIVIVGAVVGGIVGFGGMVLYNQSSSFCLKCHYNDGRYIEIDLRSPAHQGIAEGTSPGCMSCHPDKAIETVFARNVDKVQKFSQRAANLKLNDIVDPKETYPTDECLVCHPSRLEVMQRDDYLLPTDGLREIGLMLNKKLHYQFETFTPEDAQRYQELRSKTVRTEEANEELQLLEKIRTGNCGQCHIQNREQIVDKGVNFIARNPITCAGCHEDAKTSTHPGEMLQFPSRETCRKCHHGKIHGKFMMFKADCDDQIETEHCVKCHPYYDESRGYAIAMHE